MKSTYKIMADTWTWGHVRYSLGKEKNALFMPKGKWWGHGHNMFKVISLSQYRDSYCVVELKPYKKHEWNVAGVTVNVKDYLF